MNNVKDIKAKTVHVKYYSDGVIRHDVECKMLRESDVIKLVEELEQRAEAAEAKLAELEKQEPVGYTYSRGINCEIVAVDLNDDCPCGVDLFTRPAPAVRGNDHE